jgi:hypothetical protein
MPTNETVTEAQTEELISIQFTRAELNALLTEAKNRAESIDRTIQSLIQHRNAVSTVFEKLTDALGN